MKILNAMFSKGLGGIEQAFLDYSRGIEREGHEVVQVVHRNAEIKKYIKGDYYQIRNYSKYDPFTIFRLRKIIDYEKPDCIITHGNRAARMCQYATTKVPIFSLCHNYWFKQLLKSQVIITVSQDLKRNVIKAGFPANCVIAMPNMIDIEEDDDPGVIKFRNPPIIGTLVRFVENKRVDMLIEALKLLDNKGIKFKAVIGGDGAERKKLEELSQKFNLQSKVNFLGWVEDKELFYKNIDIFCLNSLHEPFGIVILESFKYARPIIVTKTEGPSEIVQDEVNGILCEKNAESLANKIELLLSNEQLAITLAKKGFETCKSKYSTNIVMKQVLENISRMLGGN